VRHEAQLQIIEWMAIVDLIEKLAQGQPGLLVFLMDLTGEAVAISGQLHISAREATQMLDKAIEGRFGHGV
jgi:hypothetical protein